jgi:hypothetical protein
MDYIYKMYRQLLKSYVTRAEQIELNKKSPENDLYIKEGRITQKEFKNNPNIIYEFTKKPDVCYDLECVECKETKNSNCFDHNRNVCKLCRKNQGKIRTQNRLENDIKQIEDENNLKNIIKNIPITYIHTIMKHYSITRSSTDKKDDCVAKIIEYFRKLQDPKKCLGKWFFFTN